MFVCVEKTGKSFPFLYVCVKLSRIVLVDTTNLSKLSLKIRVIIIFAIAIDNAFLLFLCLKKVHK